MRFWVEYMGTVWCGAAEEAEQALEHSTQAVRYVLQGKNDCLRSTAQVRLRPSGTKSMVSEVTSLGCRVQI